MLQREFPRFASQLEDPVGRRGFLKVMGASLALAGVTGCTRQPAEAITPYVRQPEEILPGKPLFYASAMPLAGLGTGVLVETHEGRPTKVEGNPEHPASGGATDAFMQASVLDLYDPDRSQTVTYLGEIRPFSAFLDAMRSAVTAQYALSGQGLRILTETVTSPTVNAQIRALQQGMPKARWHQYEPLARDNRFHGTRIAFGRPLNPLYRMGEADVILSLEADFLGGGPGQLRHAADFAARRRLDGDREPVRLYAVEGSASITGAKADHRLLLRPSDVERVAHAVAAALGQRPQGVEAPHSEWIARVVADLQAHRGRSLVVAGDSQPAVVHALAHAMNDALGNAGRTVVYTEPVEASPVDQHVALRDLVRDMNEGRVDLLLILGGNPVYNAPSDLEFTAALERVAVRAHLSTHVDETSERCHWHVPEAHWLESWGDVRAYDGTVTIQQPMIRPLYGGRSPLEVLATLSDRPDRKAHDMVREYWSGRAATEERGDFEAFWQRSLHDGFVADSALPVVVPELKASQVSREAARIGVPRSEGLEIAFRPDPSVHDGRFANNGWLQELPKPLTKLTWDNAALLSVATARELGVGTSFSGRGGEHGETLADTVELTLGGRSLTVPVWVVPDQPDGSVTLHLGYGRTRCGRVGDGAGFDAYKLRRSETLWRGTGLGVRPTDGRHALANTQGHWNMEGRDLVRSGSLEHYRRDPSLAPPHHHEIPDSLTLYPGHEYEGYAWGMTIDLNACTGCNACIVACQSENNIPVVGKEQVAAGREMHWLRVDRYHKGDPETPEELETYFQPVPCMQCENAPCELVCPVAATVHSAEGLNDMVYNRCVGTRYCSNNCPYKVRRFNFFLYQDWDTPSLKMQRNPDVTVRSRGVMEKCTYCVQRINRGKIAAELEDRPVRDGEVQTACQAACPSRAISFGNINDETSEVARQKAGARNYGLLPQLNTKPRTTYLGAVRNWNAELRRDEGGHGESHPAHSADPHDEG
jgi:molybdopterin-containing oxidoreductase family iron-sulfur binding subunit